MSRKAGIIGYGELGKQIHDFLSVSDSNYDFYFFDDEHLKTKGKHALPFNDFKKQDFRDFDFFIGLGYKHLSIKPEIINELLRLKRNLPSFIHPSCFFNSSAKIGPGTVIYPMCNIDKGVKIGNGVLLNNTVTLSHDTVIGDACFLSPGVTASGNVSIGEGAFIGAGSVISNGINIGKNVQIGIGSVVNSNIPDNCSAIGNPLRLLGKRINIL